MKNIPIFLGGVAVLFFMSAALVQIMQPTAISNSVTVYEELPQSVPETNTSELEKEVVFDEAIETVETENESDLDVLVDLLTEPIACAKDSMMCADGSSVGRVAPDCRFAVCTNADPSLVPEDTRFCPEDTPADLMCLDVYEPVCGKVEIKCEGTVCTTETKTFGNGCNACQNKDVISYVGGACEDVSNIY